MATLQERRLGYHSLAGLEPGTSRFSTLHLNHYAARGMYTVISHMFVTSHTFKLHIPDIQHVISHIVLYNRVI
jgi:hypothetical protein